MARPVQVTGLNELRRSLRTLDRDARREVQKISRAAASIVATEARRNAPRRTGALAASIRAGTSGSSAVVRSPLPYAKVHEYGGQIKPRGASITIKRTMYVHRALDDKAELVGKSLAEGFDRLARANGWR